MQNEKKPHPRSVFENFELKEKEDDAIPLTPALSLGERETHNPALGTKRNCGLAEDWRTILPLPQGEGRGEGKATVRHPNTLQASIDSAIARSFVYRFLARAFEDPEEQGWWWIGSTETRQALWTGVKTLTNPALEAAAFTFASRLTPEAFESFAGDYLAAFGHTVRGDCPLNEIEYGDIKADPLFQPHRLADLGAFYRAFGVEVAEDAAERHDHICLELEFMSVLTAKEAYALEHQLDGEPLELCRDAQKKFLREHLGRWTPAFTRRLARIVGNGALGALANFTRTFVEVECARFGLAPGSEDLLLRPVDESGERLCDSCGITNLLPGALTTNLPA